MKDLDRKALIGILRTFFMLVAAIFIPVWTLRYWQGWACLATFFIPVCVISVDSTGAGVMVGNARQRAVDNSDRVAAA